MGWLFHMKTLTNSLFFVLVSVLQPVIFASIMNVPPLALRCGGAS